MSTVLKFSPLPHRQPRPSGTRLSPPYILTNVAAVLATVEGLQIHTPEDLRYAIFLLELANICIRLVIKQVEREAVRRRLLAESTRIDQLIDVVRSDAAHLLAKNSQLDLLSSAPWFG